jgi:hypothetical protein
MLKDKSLWCVGVVLLSILAVAPSMMAQTSSTGALTGTVTDPTGAVVANVTVTLTNTDTGQARTATTGSDGTYKIGLLPPGSYRIQFEAAGFNSIALPTVTIIVTETAVLDRRLEVGAQSQAITVQGEVETVQTASSTVGTVVLSQTLTSLPLTSRNYTALLGLSAGANVNVYNAAQMGRGTQDISVNGAFSSQNNYQQDGAPIDNLSGTGNASDAGNNSGISIANPDAIQEFKIQTSLFDAGYGRNAGANVNVVTKSGANQFHGSAFEFFRNTALNANDFFRNQSPPVSGVPNNSRQVLNQNQYGGSFGGPVKKDKLFFFTSYQETQQKNGITPAGFSTPSLVPLPSDRSNAAALSAAVGANFCPTGSDGGKVGNTTAFPGVGAVTEVACNGSNINPVALAYLQLKNPDGTYYIPGSSGSVTNPNPCSATNTSCTSVSQNTTFSVPARYGEHQAIGNVDYVINSKNTFSGRWFYTDDNTNASFGCGATGTTITQCLPNTGEGLQFINDDSVAKLTTIVNNNVVNEFRISLQRSISNITVAGGVTNSQVGIADDTVGVDEGDAVTITGLMQFGQYGGYNKWLNGLQFADQISWSHGKHTIRAGFEYERDQYNQNSFGLSKGTLTFQTFQDFLLGLPGCGGTDTAATCAAKVAAGTANGSSVSDISSSGTIAKGSIAPNGIGLPHSYRNPAGNAFVQDDFKVSPRLTLNLGLRWEYIGMLSDATGRITNVWPQLIDTVPIPGSTPATGTLAGFVVPANYNPALFPAPPVGGLFQNRINVPTQSSPPLTNFAPRFGFAWQPTSSDRLVVRGGFGSFYDRSGQINITTPLVQSYPYSVPDGQSGSANYFSSFAQPYAPTPLGWVPRWANIAAGTSSNLIGPILQPTYASPLVYEWNLDVQYEFKPKWVLELGYVGSHGYHLGVSSNPLQINEAQLASVADPVYGLTTNTTGNASVRVPYLGFSPGGLDMYNTLTSTKFNSVQATLRKQFSYGFQMQAAYTFSRSFNTPFNYNNPNIVDYAVASAYHPQRLAITYSWDLPLGTHQGFVGKMANGWNLAGVTTVQDGTPLTPTDSRGGSIYGFGAGSTQLSTAEYCPGMDAANTASSGSDQQRLGGLNGGQGWFNKAAFFGSGTNGGCAAAGATGTPTIGNGTGWGNSGLGIVLGPGQFNWDATLQKTTQVGGLREDANLIFRVELFNMFNHPQFSNPSVVDVSKATFGQITSSSVNPRLIQFALKYAF